MPVVITPTIGISGPINTPPCPPPPPPALPSLTNTLQSQHHLRSEQNSSSNLTVTAPQDLATRKQQQPLSAISIQDLNSVQVCILPFSRS